MSIPRVFSFVTPIVFYSTLEEIIEKYSKEKSIKDIDKRE